MGHNINEKNFFNNLLKKRIMNELVDYRCSEKNVKKGSFIFHQHQVVYKHHQNFGLTNSETKCHLKMKFCTDFYFNETLCPKLNWNLERGPLKVTLHHLDIANKVL